MYNPDEECKTMINKLKKICKLRNITPYALAKEAGISTSTMSYLMKGKTKPYVYTILMLCNVLDIHISELFDDNMFNDSRTTSIYSEGKMKYITCKEEEMLIWYRYLSDEKKELLRIYVDMLRKYDGELLRNGKIERNDT